MEKRIGFPLPEEARESYRVHNGTDETAFPSHVEYDSHGGRRVMIESGELVTLKFMGQLFLMAQKFEQDNYPPEILVPEIRPLFWSSRRLVLTADASDSGLRVDLDPAEGGTVGQVIRHDRSLGPTALIAPSWAALLERIVADIEAGIYYSTADYPWNRHDLEARGENFVRKK